MKSLFLVVLVQIVAALTMKEYEGVWDGTFYSYSANKLKLSFPLRHSIKPLANNCWTWITEFLGDQPMKKDYKICSKGGNVWVVDQGDVQLTGYLFDNKLYFAFGVQGTHLTTTTEFGLDRIEEVLTAGKEISSGNPSVKSYSIDNIQKFVYDKRTP